MGSPSTSLELKVPPVLAFLIGGAAAHGLAALDPLPRLAAPGRLVVAGVLALAGWVVAIGSTVAAVVVAAFVLFLGRFQIRPEERLLSAKFGEAFEDYRRRVRRWRWRITRSG